MLSLSERTLGQWLEHWAETTPDKEYIVYSDRNLRFTWSQFNKRVDDMAKGLMAIGVEKGTHVGLWAANVPDWLTILYACAKIGAVAVTVNTNYKQSELEYLCENSDMHTLCIVNCEKDSDFVQMTYTMLPELRTCQRGHLKSERFPRMKNVVYIGQEKFRGMYNTPELLLLGSNIANDKLIEAKKQVSCHDVVNMQYTSGTTGFPKGVMLTHYNIANNGFLTGEHMKFTQDDKLCVCVPLFHCFGLCVCVNCVLTLGSTVILVPQFDAKRFDKLFKTYHPTIVAGVPTLYEALLTNKHMDGMDLSVTTNMFAYDCPNPIKPVDEADGEICKCELKDKEELADLIELFHDETGIDQMGRKGCLDLAEQKINEGKTFFWTDTQGNHVATCNYKIQGDLASIGLVYTRKEHRRKHYAENLVYLVTRMAEEEGSLPMLYTDADYIASNACYEKIGYILRGKLCTIG